MKLLVRLIAVTFLLVACSRQHSDSGVAVTTNQPGKTFTTKDGSTVAIGAFSIGGTNVPLTNIQVR